MDKFELIFVDNIFIHSKLRDGAEVILIRQGTDARTGTRVDDNGEVYMWVFSCTGSG